MARPKDSQLRKLKAATLAVLAVSFGVAAHRLNRQETDLEWRKSHLPSAEIWKASFAAEGFESVANPTVLAHATRALPSLTDSTGKIWSGDQGWWAVESSNGEQPLVFCLECDPRKAPKTWSPVGEGWSGWERALELAREEARKGKEARLTAGKLRKPREKADPREIRY